MTDLRKAAQQALRSLRDLTGDRQYEYQIREAFRAIAALEQALAEPQTTHWEGCEAVHPECKEKNT